MKSRVLATEKFDEFAAPVPDLNAHNRTNVSNSHLDVKLPKLNLPKFSGDVLQWSSFWDQFSVTVHDTDLPVVSKFTYLMSLLEGEPKQAIHGLSLTADQCAIACKILKDRFGRKETIIFTHIQKFLHLSVPSKCTVSALWKLNDELQAHIRSLEALGIDGKQYGVILTPMILSQMPRDIRMEWSRDGGGHESDLNFLLKFLEKEIQRRERSQVFCDSMSVSGKTTVEERRPKVPTVSALPSSSVPGKVKPNCGVCNKGHLTEKMFQTKWSNHSTKRKAARSWVMFPVFATWPHCKGMCSCVLLM